ncbi:hypothetical protein CZP2022_140 [Vibrio phage C-ZP2022]|nr:hypothetical protein CZP2022_140 [Vibrio phage C-ZP2022]
MKTKLIEIKNSIVNFVTETAPAAISNAWTWVKSQNVTSLWESIKGLATSAFEAVKGFFSNKDEEKSDTSEPEAPADAPADTAEQ